jgi:hypothetical protein
MLAHRRGRLIKKLDSTWGSQWSTMGKGANAIEQIPVCPIRPDRETDPRGALEQLTEP